MKQRLLFALLMLFTSIGWMDAQIVLTSNGTKDVVVTLDQPVANPTTSTTTVTVSDDKRTVTIKQGYTTQVTVEASAAPTQISVDGNLTSLAVTANSLTSLSFGSDNYVKGLTISSTSLESLTCANLGMESLTLTDASALKTLDASNNRLPSVSWPTSPLLEDVNLSDNLFISLIVSSLRHVKHLVVSNNQLTSLDVSSCSELTHLDISNNRIVSLTPTPPSTCDVTYGAQTIIPNSTDTWADTDANKGFNLRTLIKNSPISATTTDYSSVRWEVLDGTTYKDADNITAHRQSEPWADEWRFYDYSTKSYVKGTYRVTFDCDGRTYVISDLDVWTAKFTLKGESVNTKATGGFQVSIDGAPATDVSTSPMIKQGQKLVFTVKGADGYANLADYEIKGLTPSNGNLTAPYRGASFECVVDGKYASQSESEEPWIRAVAIANSHVVKYQGTQQEGGSFSVEKQTGTTVTALASGENISTGDKLLVKIKPKTGYDCILKINGVDKTSEVKKEEDGGYTYTQEIDDQTDGSLSITVTFSNATIGASIKVDGKELSNTPYIVNNKVTLTIQGGTGTQDITDGTEAKLLPNTTYQAIFSMKKENGTVYRLQAITINGEEPITRNEDKQADGSMKYTVTFKVETSDVILSITSKQMKTVAVIPEGKGTPISQEQVYDGNAKPVLFTTNPSGLEENVEVKYVNTTGNIDMGTTAPVNVGTYAVTLNFKEKGLYVADAITGTKCTLNIVKAALKIETLPTVTVDKSGAYAISGGEVTFNGAPVAGTFTTNPSTPTSPGKSHAVEVIFTPTSTADQCNFENATATVNVIVGNDPLDLYQVSMVDLPSSAYTIEWLNGNQTVDLSTDRFAEGTVLTAIITYPKGMKDVELVKTSALGMSGVQKDNVKSSDGRLIYTVIVKENTELKVQAGTGDSYSIVLNNQTFTYDGTPKAYDAETKVTISNKDNQTVAWNSIASLVRVTYIDASGVSVVEPVDAGTYTVCVTIAADPTTGYIESKAEKAALTIEKIQPVVYKWPEASVIAKGQTLMQSELTGGAANIAGTFTWKDATESFPTAGEYRRAVVFTPNEEYTKNYLTVETRGGEALDGTGTADNQWVTFTVSNLQIVTYSQKTEGGIKVLDQTGKELPTGSAVTEGDVLTIVATPNANFTLKQILVNGIVCSGSYTVGTASVAIDAVFEVVPTEVIDPNSQYAVTLPQKNSVRGAVINKAGVNAVKKDQSFSFTVNTLAADAGKLVVQANGVTLTPSDGTYTIEKVTANTSITVSLSNPTSLNVSIERETKNAKGYKVGTVLVEGPTDDRYYYGDEITLVAQPESGVTFVGWLDDSSVKDRLRALVLTKDVTIAPLFSGTPTDIDSIEMAKVYGSRGCIVLRGIGEANVTIVSMDGRIQKQLVNGDTQIYTSAGVYGVVLEQGSEVKRLKVIVR